MIRRKINQKSKELKVIILNLVQSCIEPFLWDEFNASFIEDRSGRYQIFDNDLPSIRDLKALMNMLSAVERITESYSLYAISFFKKFEIPYDLWDLRQNYKLYMSTNSVLTYYFAIAKEYISKVTFPKVLQIVHELYLLCTTENLQKGAELFIEQIIALEQYQQKYEISKRQKEKTVGESVDQKEGFFTTLVKTNDHYLRRLYKSRYDIYFGVDKKDEKHPKEKFIDYYNDMPKDTDTIKHIKKISNGIIGIKKVLDDYVAYKNAGVISSVSWMGTFLMDLRKAYIYLQDFDYQAIIAEQSKPSAEYIKVQLKELNNTLKQLAVLADQCEAEYCLRENLLLKSVDLLINRYDQITSELKIPIDYSIQKRVYYKARLESRETYLRYLDKQISDLTDFIRFKDSAIVDIPKKVRVEMEKFIKTYEDDISMDRNNIVKYKQYLTDAPEDWLGLRMFMKNQMEQFCNSMKWTIHSEIMSSFQKRKLYLEKQRSFLRNRLSGLKQDTLHNPYDNFILSDIKRLGCIAIIERELKNHLQRLKYEKDELLSINYEPVTIILTDVKSPLDIKSPVVKSMDFKVADNKTITSPLQVATKPKEISDRYKNQVMIKTQEHQAFDLAIHEFEKNKDVFSMLKMLRKEDCLGIKSLTLLDEIVEISKLYNKYPPGTYVNMNVDPSGNVDTQIIQIGLSC